MLIACIIYTRHVPYSAYCVLVMQVHSLIHGFIHGTVWSTRREQAIAVLNEVMKIGTDSTPPGQAQLSVLTYIQALEAKKFLECGVSLGGSGVVVYIYYADTGSPRLDKLKFNIMQNGAQISFISSDQMLTRSLEGVTLSHMYWCHLLCKAYIWSRLY